MEKNHLYRILICATIFMICKTQNNQDYTTEEFQTPVSEAPSETPQSSTTEDDQSYQPPSHTPHEQNTPSLAQLSQSMLQLQQQLSQLVSWQENTNNVFQQRMDSLSMDNANMQQGLQAFTQNTHVRLLELERTYAKSFMFTAFTATGTEARAFRAGSTIEFKNIVTNEGGAYNSESSVFNCQYDGFFHFQFTIVTSSNQPVEVQLFNAGKPVVSSKVSGSSNILTNTAVVFCEGGDQVVLKVKNDFQQHLEYDGKHSTFSGYAVAAVEESP